jgi:hypothetical protein
LSSDVQGPVFSAVFSRVESRFNHFRTVIDDPGARVAAIYAIDDEIDQQLKAVDAAKQLLHSQLARRNTLVPISLLPPEVLARVFHLLVLNDTLGPITATHVCRFWRQVALDDSSLWAKISSIMINPKLFSEMLVRAKNAPLDIHICLRSRSGREVLRIFPPHLSHTRTLRLYSLSSTTLHPDSVEGIYSREAQALEHFELRGSVRSTITFRELEGAALFKGRAPRLRTLCLSQVLIPWSLIPRGQLTQLSIRLFEELPTPSSPLYGDLNQLIDLLDNCPGLELLILERCLPSQLPRISYGQTIHLPHLSRLCLGGSSSRITNLMKMLKLPSSTRLHLNCVSENTPTYHDSLLLSVVAAQFQVPAPVEFKTLSVTISSKSNLLGVTASTTPPSWRSCQSKDFEGDVDNKPEFVLSIDGLHELGYCVDRLGRVCNMLPISDLEFLSISSFDILDSPNWVELFKRCTKLTSMQAIGQGTISLVWALTTPKLINMTTDRKGKKRKRDDRDSTLASSPVVPAEMPIFPKLSLLSLKNLDFAENEHPSGILFNVVERGLQQRKVASNAPFGVLRIEDCVINARRVDALQKLVQEFQWDGKDVFDRSEDDSDSDSE